MWRGFLEGGGLGLRKLKPAAEKRGAPPKSEKRRLLSGQTPGRGLQKSPEDLGEGVGEEMCMEGGLGQGCGALAAEMRGQDVGGWPQAGCLGAWRPGNDPLESELGKGDSSGRAGG